METEDIKELKQKIIRDRWDLCTRCVHLLPKVNICKKCGCFMPVKTKLEKARCPIGKWEKIDIKEIPTE